MLGSVILVATASNRPAVIKNVPVPLRHCLHAPGCLRQGQDALQAWRGALALCQSTHMPLALATGWLASLWSQST